VDAFDAAGRLQARATFPAGSRLLAVTGRGWYLAQRNDDDEERLVRYRRVR
jgi:hypothetical protein